MTQKAKVGGTPGRAHIGYPNTRRRNDGASERNRAHPHYLKGSVFCAQCGSRLCLTQAKGQYLYFFCLGRHQRRTVCAQPYLPAEAIETAVERYYQTVRLPKETQETVRTGLRAELDTQQRRAEPEIAYARARVTELDAERRRLARGVVTGAIPEDLARDEQQRIARDLTQAQKVLDAARVIYAHIEDTLNRALALVGRVDEVYRLGGPRVRRLADEFVHEMILNTANPDRDLDGRGFEYDVYGAPGVIRTPDSWFRKPLLYPLSYGGRRGSQAVILPAPSCWLALRARGPDDVGVHGLTDHERTSLAIASVASRTFASASLSPALAASTTQLPRCSASSSSENACNARVAAATWVRTSMQYLSSSTIRCSPRTCPSMRRNLDR
jgi:hypothetical protein